MSDTHGFGLSDLPVSGDVLIHAGDFWLDGGSRNANLEAFEAFDAWLARQDFREKLVIRGNHDPFQRGAVSSN